MRHLAVARWLARCDSELERAFSLAILIGDEFDFRPLDDDRFVDASGLVFAQKQRIRPIAGRAIVVDFTLATTSGGRLAIEIDGSVFHDGAEAVQQDRERDRRLLAAGWRVVRYSEREIANDVTASAREAVEIARLNGAAKAEQLPLSELFAH